MNKRILVAVDFSKLSEPAVDYAVRLATGSGAQVDLLHVVIGALPAPTMGHPSAQELVEQLNRSENEASVRRLESMLHERVPEALRGRAILADGSPAEAICAQATNTYEMVVVSTNGRTGLSHILLGSVAERVVRFAKIPVLVVR